MCIRDSIRTTVGHRCLMYEVVMMSRLSLLAEFSCRCFSACLFVSSIYLCLLISLTTYSSVSIYLVPTRARKYIIYIILSRSQVESRIIINDKISRQSSPHPGLDILPTPASNDFTVVSVLFLYLFSRKGL